MTLSDAAFVKAQRSVERLRRAALLASAGDVSIDCEIPETTKFNAVLQGPERTLRRVDNVSRQTLDAISTVLEGIAEARGKAESA